MSTVTDEMVEAAKAAFIGKRDWIDTPGFSEKMAAAISAALALRPAPEPVGEPVTWARIRDDGRWTFWETQVSPDAFPLYRSAPVDVEVERLTVALEKLLSYNEDIQANRINYYPHDHIAVARAALARKGGA